MQAGFATCDDSRCDWRFAHLRELATDGAPRWSCALPIDAYRYRTLETMGTLALGDGVLAVASRNLT